MNKKRKIENAICVWDITVPKSSTSVLELKTFFKKVAKKWAFQEELGSEGKFEHYQCRASLGLKTRNPLDLGLVKTAHWSPTSDENKDNNFYVLKEDRISGPWTNLDEDFYIPRQIREIPGLRAWQQHIVDDAKVWNTRTINIILDTCGNNGKSILKTFVGVNKIGRALPYTNDYKDIMRMVMDTPKKSLYIIDIPRALKKDQMYQFFSGIETLKDGYAYDDRYHFKEEYFDCPNIWIFMNVRPDSNYLSNDRWKIWEIKEDFSLEETG